MKSLFKITTILFLFINIASCGDLSKYGFVEIEFQPYMSCFNKNSRQIRNDLIITFNPNLKAVGVCKLRENKIEINNYEWINSTSYQKEFILFHELGHCVLMRNHNDNYFNYMNTFYPAHETIKQYRQVLYDDFFGPDNKICEY